MNWPLAILLALLVGCAPRAQETLGTSACIECTCATDDAGDDAAVADAADDLEASDDVADESDAPAPTFAIVLLPDTQYAAKRALDATNPYRKQTQWIVDHQAQDNIVFAIHLGDVTNGNTSTQWWLADAAHDTLDAADIPFSIIPGNHDYLTAAGFSRSASLFSTYFAPTRFTGRSWYGGAYDGEGASSFATFTAGGDDYLVVSLEYAPRAAVVAWAAAVLDAHPAHRALLVTHCYLGNGGTLVTTCPDPAYATEGTTPAELRAQLVDPYPSIFLVVSGHVGDSEHVTRVRADGSHVTEMVVDYQSEAACGPCTGVCPTGVYLGNGWMRRLVFDGTTVHADTLTPEDGNASIFPGGVPVLAQRQCPCAGEVCSPNPAYSADPSAADHAFSFPL